MIKVTSIMVAALGVAMVPVAAAQEQAAPAQDQVAPPVVPVPSAAPAANTPAAEADPVAYVLGVGDVIETSLIGRGEWKARVKIQVDGSVTLPLIGRVEASNRTSLQLADELKTKLKSGGFFANPVVSVEIASYASRYATVLGDVGQPGLVPMDREYRMSEVLARVGGVRDSGADILSLRRETGEELTLSIHDLATGGPDKDPQVLPGDKIFVPAATMFFIYGQVNSPGTHKLDRAMSLRQAIARSGGLTPSGSEKRIKVYRNGQEIEKYSLGDTLQGGDVVVVGERFF